MYTHFHCEVTMVRSILRNFRFAGERYSLDEHFVVFGVHMESWTTRKSACDVAGSSPCCVCVCVCGGGGGGCVCVWVCFPNVARWLSIGMQLAAD